jgi:hypothetical protein
MKIQSIFFSILFLGFSQNSFCGPVSGLVGYWVTKAIGYISTTVIVGTVVIGTVPTVPVATPTAVVCATGAVAAGITKTEIVATAVGASLAAIPFLP